MPKGLLTVGLLILALAWLLTLRRNGTSGGSDTRLHNQTQTAKSDNSRKSAHSATKSDSLANGLVNLEPSPDVLPSENFPDYGTHEPENLPQFHLPPIEAKNVTLRELVRLTLQSYVDVCTVTKQEPLRFSVNFSQQNDQRKDIKFSGGSLTSMLLKAGLQFQNHFSREETQLSFQHYDSTTKPLLTNIDTHIFPLPPTFASDLHNFLSATPPDPNTPFQEGKLEPRRSVSGLLKEAGIILSEGTSASYAPSSSTLTIKDDPANIKALTALIEEISTPPVQFKTTTKLMESSEKLATFPSVSQSSEQTTRLMREFAQTKGVDMVSLPAVVSHNGASATVEIVTESEDDCTGIRIQTDASRYGFGQQQSLGLEIREEGENAKPYQSAKFETQEIGPNSSALVHSSQTTTGETIYTLSTVSLVDATGRPFDPLALQNTPEIESTSDQ